MGQGLNYKSIAFAAMVTTLLLSIGSLFLLRNAESAVREDHGPQRLFISGTYVTTENAVPRPLPADGALELSDGKTTVTVTGHFDRDVPSGELLSLRLDNLYLRFFVDDGLIFEYGAPYSVLPNVRSSGNGWQYFSSPGITAGQEIRLELSNLYDNHTNSTYQAFFQNLYAGNPAVHISRDLRATLLQSVIAIFILIMGFLELAYAIALIYAKANANEFFTLAGLSITYGVWLLIRFETLELFFPFPIVNNALQHLSLSLALCYALLYTATQLTAWRRFCIRTTAVAALILTVVSISFQHLGILDYYDFTYPLYLLLGIAALEMLLLLFLEYLARRKEMARSKVYPLCVLLIGALADVCLGLFGIVSFLCLEIAFCFFTCCQLYLVLRSVMDVSRDRANILLLQEDHARQQRLLEYQLLLSSATKGLYESIYELDLTHNRAGDEATRKYFESLGLPGDISYDEALRHIANAQIHPEYREGYVAVFAPMHALEEYGRGVDTLQYDFLITEDGGESYYWMRIDARIFFWKGDGSVRMLVFRQNVDSEKRQELELLNRADQDSLTGLLNREALERQARAFLAGKSPTCGAACLILDIDNFKTVNDTFGHMAGDFVLSQLAVFLRSCFSGQDVIGRLGGDEFAIIALCADEEKLCARTDALLTALATAHTQFEHRLLPLSVSIGAAYLPSGTASFEAMYKRSDEALYQSKKEGKKRCTISRMEEYTE